MFTPKTDFTLDNRINTTLWLMFAFQAGAINTGGLMVFHRFVSHMTGFASHFGLELAQNNYSAALSMASVPVFFLVGAMVAALLVDHQIYENKPPKYFYCAILISYFLLIASLGGTLGYFGEFGKPNFEFSDYVLIAMLAMTTGLQNALLISKNGQPIRTTHLTGITTDLGIGIIRLLLRKTSSHLREQELSQNIVRGSTILFFILGSGASAFIFYHFHFFGFVLPFITSLIFIYYCLASHFCIFPFNKSKAYK